MLPGSDMVRLLNLNGVGVDPLPYKQNQLSQNKSYIIKRTSPIRPELECSGVTITISKPYGFDKNKINIQTISQIKKSLSI
jgi:hypothetical protein